MNSPRIPSPATLVGALISALRSRWTPATDVRAEAWALGARHRGRVLEGARNELKTPGLSAERAVLLRAVIRSRRRQPDA